MRRDVSENGIHTTRPHELKVGDSVQPGHEIDSGGSDSKLNDPAGSRDIPDPDAKVSAEKIANGLKDALCILRSRVKVDVEVLCGARASMKRDGVRADDEESSAASIQGLDELFVVAGFHGFLSL